MKVDTALAGSYQVTMSLFAVVLVPLWIIIINVLYLRQNLNSIADVAQQIAFVQLIPITAGMVIRGWVPIRKIGSFWPWLTRPAMPG